MNLTWSQRRQIAAAYIRWDESPAPCGIPRADPYWPCLPENDDPRPLLCLTCGQRQRRAITTGTGDKS